MGNNRNIQNIWSMTTFIRNDQKNGQIYDMLIQWQEGSWIHGSEGGMKDVAWVDSTKDG